MSTTTREALAGSKSSRELDYMVKKFALLAIRLFVSVNLLYAAIFAKFARVPRSVALFAQMSQAVHGLISQPIFRLGSGVFRNHGGSSVPDSEDSQIWGEIGQICG